MADGAFQLSEADVAMLARLRSEHLLTRRARIPLLDVAIDHYGGETDARQALQRLLALGLIELDVAADVKNHCFGTVAERALFEPGRFRIERRDPR